MNIKKSLYKINEDIVNILENEEAVNPETGEVNPEALEELNNLTISKSEKIQNYARFIQFLDNQEQVFKAEKARIDKLNNQRKNLMEYLKKGIIASMIKDNTDRYEFDTLKITRSKGQYSLIIDPEKEKELAKHVIETDEKLKQYKKAFSDDKKALKEKLKKQYDLWEKSPDPDKKPLPEWIDGARLERKPGILIR